MKVFLLHRDHDFNVDPELRDVMFAAMMSGNLYAIPPGGAGRLSRAP